MVKLDIADQKVYLCKRERHEAAGTSKDSMDSRQPSAAETAPGSMKDTTDTKKLLNAEKKTHRLLTIKKERKKDYGSFL